jgi:succinate dehydrogenase / fumarate reductase cytochrome b subunit
MSATAATSTGAAAPAPRPSFLDRHYHLLRRLHSLSGVVPIGAFLFPHLTTNSSIVWGRALNATKFEALGIPAAGAGVATFQHEVDFIHSLPALIFIEIFVLWLPLLFHAGLGIYYARSGRSNTARYGYQGNWRYSLQRITGYIGVIFIFLHVSSLRWGWTFGGLLPTFDPEFAASSTAEHLQSGSIGLLLAVLYLIAVLGLVYHFANGLWTAAITWGLTVSVPAQRRWGYVCAAIGVGLAAAAVSAIAGFATLDPKAAREVERALQQEPARAISPPA